jgi:phage-related protein
MTYTALPLNDFISVQGVELQHTYRTLKAQFGDGYSNETGDGINTKLKKWNVLYTNLTEANYTTLMDYLDTVQGNTTFKATPRGESEQLWRLDPASVRVAHKVINHLTNEVFRDLTFVLNRVYL